MSDHMPAASGADRFEPWDRWIAEQTRANRALPRMGSIEFFRAGYLLALRDAKVQYRGDRERLPRVRVVTRLK